ncbi:MAG: hypothetical protein ABI564_00955 [Ideonella sp.]
MNKHWTLSAAALLLAASPWTVAQTTLSPQTAAAIASEAIPPSAPSLAVRQGSGGASFISGGAGNEERRNMASQRGKFPLKVVLSADQGEYIVAEKLRLGGGKHGAMALLDVGDVGPWVMIAAPAGSYALEVTYKGKTQRRNVKVGKSPTEVNMRFPG